VSYLDESTIKAIDARIAKAQQLTTALGTVADRDTAGPYATVVFDGTQVAQPVKVLGHVHVNQGDRVALQLFGSSWVVVGTFARRGLDTRVTRVFAPSLTATTSSSFVDVPGPVTLDAFNKRYDETAILFTIKVTTWTDVVSPPTRMSTGVRVAGTVGTATETDYTAQDLIIDYMEYDVIGDRITAFGSVRLNMPAGTYDYTARWRRTAGTGQLQITVDDWTILTAAEVF
jgi:hypothetical protein